MGPPKRTWAHTLRAQVSAASRCLPYIVLAATLWPVETSSWTKPRTPLGAALRAIGLRNPALTGFPVAICVDVRRLALGLARVRGRKAERICSADADMSGAATGAQ